MKLKGGYNVLLQGRPESTVRLMPEPSVLYLPLRSKRFAFSELSVKEGEYVNAGDILARDPDNFGVPLLAPRGGKVRLEKVPGHIVIEDAAKVQEHADMAEEELLHLEQEMGAGGIKRYKLVTLGAWEFFYDAYTGAVPDPLGTPQAIIVSIASLEPFVARGDAQLRNRLLNFTRGLEQLQSLLEYQPIYLVMPDVESEFVNLLRNHIRGYAWVKIVEIPLRYPHDHVAILARRLGLKRSNGPIWAVRTEGVLATDRALTLTKPCLIRIVSIGGIGVNSPAHLNVMPGYPIKMIKERYVFEPAARLINGGILTGEPLGAEALGLDTECRGLTVLPELEDREFLGFIRPGWDRSCYAGCFLSSLRVKFHERFTTGMRGEGRPCISCSFCEDVCPAGIMPHLIHKYLYRDLIEEVDMARVDLCVECGLCSFVCPSKIDLRQQFIDAKALIEQEKQELRKEQERQEKEREEQAATKSVEEKDA
ncbi:MAG: 4Fe-4S dicluster domain-containing protein [Phycisphaerales bacterium]|nr:MAG: 4Fe-4S dicluster domain-containing protein [Phycisphaerales bacterium]